MQFNDWTFQIVNLILKWDMEVLSQQIVFL